MQWPELQFEQRMHPLINKIYQLHYPNIVKIERFEKDDVRHVLDKNFAIDTVIHFKNGGIITCQEKTRTHKQSGYDDFTFEYYNDPETGKEGEWFHCAAQLYFYGYMNKDETHYIKYYALNILKLRTWLSAFNHPEEIFGLKQNYRLSKANFIPIPFKKIPKDCFEWSHNGMSELFRYIKLLICKQMTLNPFLDK